MNHAPARRRSTTAASARRRRLRSAVTLVLVVLAVACRVALVDRQSLWADELFSLAMATGHSLEHPAAAADARLGDWVELPAAAPAARYRAYLEHETPPAGSARVIRAVSASDTNPPFYYLVLYFWTRAFGTTDAALRLFSVACAIGLIPLLIYLARRAGGHPAIIPALILFAVSPAALTYSVEGRMYALGWLLAAALLALTLVVQRRDAGLLTLSLWCLTAAGGLLTHYFFVFVWAACLGWLAFARSGWRRPALWAAVLATALLVAPWYMTVPESLARWRVSKGWLDGMLPLKLAVRAPLKLAWAVLSGHDDWDASGRGRWVVTAALAIAGVGALRRLSMRIVSPPRALLGLCVVATCAGPLAVDLLLDTHAAGIARYALLALPAGLVLTATAMARVRLVVRIVILAVLVGSAFPAGLALLRTPDRFGHAYRQIAADVRAAGPPTAVVALVHSIPSGVLGVSRYADPDARIGSWVAQLAQRRVPDSIEALTAGFSRVVFVRIHALGAPAPELDWLEANATRVQDVVRQRGRVATYRPRVGDRFFDQP